MVTKLKMGLDVLVEDGKACRVLESRRVRLPSHRIRSFAGRTGSWCVVLTDLLLH